IFCVASWLPWVGVYRALIAAFCVFRMFSFWCVPVSTMNWSRAAGVALILMLTPVALAVAPVIVALDTVFLLLVNGGAYYS
ncbi:hypothetical protein RA267_28475, partial [Pseudomonas syringae pv. tagetis]|uniref:hypothetical protein n=1 Tax=Pseudomonas syringae group genomosp. 7 TaxID=251699 RepID=UPI00376F87CD